MFTGGGLNGVYALDHFELHWGETDAQGSEHTLDGMQFPMEVNLSIAKVNVTLGNHYE